MDYASILREIEKEINLNQTRGQVASYIPELARINPQKYGLHLACMNGDDFHLGDHTEKFSIQSISKVLSLSLAMSKLGVRLWQRVDVEPSGNPFNSLIQLEQEDGIPRNPLINSGAIVIADILVSILDNPKKDFLEFVRLLAGNDDIHFNEDVARSEQDHGYRNYALANMLKSYDNLHNDVEDVLDFYFHQCSIEMSCAELAHTFLLFANEGVICQSKKRMLTRLQTKRVNSLMQTCGFYDEAGEFSFLVGLPGKSGVGGGIVAVHPGEYSVAVWSPRLNKKGNSVLGMKTLELLTTKTGKSIF
ncbi:MAG TPA: glutaminase [Cryomorphaceae bacterium]|nr:glutaminase [Owenweeksia sp.]MBF98813.1 glutaminase [Owenweeksia sp.]HAD95964.1 glutaminase [Cryomorphaceae bacterium]HBF20386.1 glutaminase [Cryomorphaceae bacterium]|tara:strand:+ start:3554 stop:4468 length:915 start_codon:yes stop_codon:yes gene_type:complete